MEINNNKVPSKVYKTIHLRTLDATADTNRINFKFDGLQLIQIKKPSILKVNSVSIGGEGHTDIADNNITVKIDNIKYNRLHYFNSDNDSIPTIANFDYSTKNTIQNDNPMLVIEPQDINTISLKIFTDDKGTNKPSHGLIKNSKPIQLFLCLSIEEIDE